MEGRATTVDPSKAIANWGAQEQREAWGRRTVQGALGRLAGQLHRPTLDLSRYNSLPVPRGAELFVDHLEAGGRVNLERTAYRSWRAVGGSWIDGMRSRPEWRRAATMQAT